MENTKNKIGMFLLLLVLTFFVVGGFYFKEYMIKNTKSSDVPLENVDDKKQDSSKDYIYFENEKEIMEDIIKEDVVINFKGMESINNTLHNELESIYSGYTLTSDVTLQDGEVCDQDIYETGYREYVSETFKEYVSLVIKDYKYNCALGSLPVALKSYVVSKETGEIITNEDLLERFNKSESDIEEAIKNRLSSTQVLDGDSQIIDIDGTLESIKTGSYGSNKALSVSKNGKLVINFIVKSNKINYNDSIEID